MIFTTVQNDLDSIVMGTSKLSNQIGILHASFKDISATLSAGQGLKGLKNLFANTNTNVITQEDLEKLKNYREQLVLTGDKEMALADTMVGASRGARDLANSVDASSEGVAKLDKSLKDVQIVEQGYIGTTISAKLATVALQAAFSFGLAVAIQAVVRVLSDLIHFQERQAEAAREQAERSGETAKKAKEEADSIEELIKKYEKLKSSEDLDASGREEIRNIQSEITKLVGTQADNLDLVNGKLDDELEKLRNISKQKAEDNLPKYRTAASDAMNETLQSKEGFGRFEIDGSTDGMGYKQRQGLFRIFSAYASKSGNYWMGSRDNPVGEFVGNKDDFQVLDTFRIDFAKITYLYRKEALDKALKFLEESLENPNGSDVYNRLSRYRTQLDEFIRQRQETLAQFVVGALVSDDYSDRDVNSLDDYKTLRQDIINDLMEDSTVKEGLRQGFIDEDWIANQADDYLAGLTKLSTYNEQFVQETKSAADDVGVAVENAGKKFASLKELFESKDGDNTLSDRIKTYRENINALNTALEQYRNDDFGDGGFNAYFLDLIDKFPQLAEHTDDLDVAITNLMNSMDADIAEDFDNQINKLSSASAVSALESVKERVISTRQAVSDLRTTLEGATSAFSTIKSAVDEWSEKGVLAADTLSNVLKLEPQYLNLLVDENGQLNLNSENYAKLVKAKLENLLVTQMQSSFNSIFSLTVEQAEAYAAAEAYDVETESIYSLLEAQMRLSLNQAREKDIANNTDAYTKAILRTAQAYSPLVSMVESYDFAAEQANKTNSEGTSALDEQKKALENQKKALEDSKKALEDYKNDLSEAQSAIKSLIDAVTDYIKQQKEDEKDALQERKDAFDELIEKEKEELAAKKESAKFDEELADKQNAYAKNKLSADIASLDDSAAGRKSQKQANDALADTRKDLVSALADHEYDIRVKALDQLKEKNDEYYDNETKKIDDYLSNARQLYEDACSMIENDTGDLYNKLWDYTYKHTTQTRAEFNHMWSAAQSAMDKYGVDQIGVISVMEYLQGEIYNTETQINNLDIAIDDLSGTIDNVSSSIDNMANTSLSNVASKIDEIRQRYEQLLREMGNSSGQVEVSATWRGKTYSQTANDSDSAINSVADMILQDMKRAGIVVGSEASRERPRIIQAIRDSIGKHTISNGIEGRVRAYASGTNAASGGLSLVGERGAELRVLNSGDGILKNQIVRGLTALGTNPAQFLAEAGQKMLATLFGNRMKSNFGIINKDSTISPSISIVVQGDATQSTLNALEVYAKKISDDTIRRIQSETLRRTYSSRVR